MPDSSTVDCDTIRELFSNKAVFPFVEDQRQRRKLSERVLNCKRILSFQSFFDDFRYIRSCFEGLSTLLPKRHWRGQKSLQQAFEHNWSGKPQDSGDRTFLSCYIELWLFAMREFPFLSNGKTSQPLHDKTAIKKPFRPKMIISGKDVHPNHRNRRHLPASQARRIAMSDNN